MTQINGAARVASYPLPLTTQTSNTVFRYRQRLRRWAAHVLLVWLFGVGVGVANACLAPTVVGLPEVGSGSAAGIQASHHQGAAVPKALHHAAGPNQNVDAPDHREPAAGSNCQDFCAKATVSMPPLKSALDDVQACALPPHAMSTALAVPALPWVQPWVPRRDGVRALPIPIAFLRLAL
ncbi:MAG: hypothetical protein IH627_03795 [Rubrivivax sp.]|nr:hypothetical protein [Rubrivivax sp.]